LSKHRHNSELTSKRVPTLKKRSDKKTNFSRVGYTVTKKVGNAVIRNRIRRRLREVVSKTFPQKSLANHDYVIIGKYGALTRDFTSILKDLEQALDHVHRNEAKGFKKFN